MLRGKEVGAWLLALASRCYHRRYPLMAPRYDQQLPFEQVEIDRRMIQREAAEEQQRLRTRKKVTRLRR